MKFAINHCQVERFDEKVKFTGICIQTKKPYSVTVPFVGILNYSKGMLIQEAFPDLEPEEREFLISGISPEGWKILFGPR